MEFHERLRATRERLGMKQNEAATKIGIKNNTLSSYESGDRQPDYNTLIKIADLYEVSTEYLLRGKANTANVSVAGNQITLTPEEMQIFEELKKHPVLFHDLATNPEKKVKELIKLQKMKKLFLEEDDEEYGDGFGELDD